MRGCCLNFFTYTCTVAGQSHAAARLVPNSHMSGCVPMVRVPSRSLSPGSHSPHHPKLSGLKLRRIIGASACGHFTIIGLKLSGGNMSNAFAPPRKCQSKCAFAAPLVYSGGSFILFTTFHCAFGTWMPCGAFTPSDPSKYMNLNPAL